MSKDKTFEFKVSIPYIETDILVVNVDAIDKQEALSKLREAAKHYAYNGFEHKSGPDIRVEDRYSCDESEPYWGWPIEIGSDAAKVECTVEYEGVNDKELDPNHPINMGALPYEDCADVFYADGTKICRTNSEYELDWVRLQIKKHRLEGCYVERNGERYSIDANGHTNIDLFPKHLNIASQLSF